MMDYWRLFNTEELKAYMYSLDDSSEHWQEVSDELATRRSERYSQGLDPYGD